jgi:hypothetical protein
MNRSITLFQLIISLLFIVIGFAYFYINNSNITKKSEKLKINGIVQNKEINEKGYLNLTIKGTVYYFPISNEVHEFKIGDSIVKEKNSKETIQYRNGKIIQSYYVDVIK